MIAEIIAAEDKMFLDATDRAHKHYEAMRERRRWRDGNKVIHELRPVAASVIANVRAGGLLIEGWTVTCGHVRRSTVEHDPNLPVSCIRCITIALRFDP